MRGGIEFVVLGVPAAWQRAGRRPNGISFTPKATAQWEAKVLSAYRQTVGAAKVGVYQAGSTKRKIKGRWLREPLFGSEPLEVEIDFHLPDRKRKDLDNLAKTIDALNIAAWRDDSAIERMALRKFYDAPNPRAVIRIARIGDPGVLCDGCKGAFTFRRGPGDDAVPIARQDSAAEHWMHAACVAKVAP